MRKRFPSLVIGLMLLLPCVTSQAAINVGDKPQLQAKSTTGQNIDLKQLSGKLVLVDFWATWCGPCMNEAPHMVQINKDYASKGLVMIGIHAPEFAFEKDLNNVRRAVKDMRIDYPVAVDNELVIWRAFSNEEWPALYFIDSKGRVRHHYFGEGAYEESETVIQQLLTEAGVSGVGHELVSVDAGGIEAAADWSDLKSPETYVGYGRTQNFVSPGGAAPDQPRVYTLPSQLHLNDWALSGDWTVKKQATALDKPNGRIAYRFHARDLNLVMGPPAPGTFVKFRVLIDGQPPAAARGVDVDEQGIGTITEQRVYQLIRQPKPIADRQFEIEFFDSGVQAFSFTFG